MNVAQLGTLRASAVNGEDDAQYQLGFMYSAGRDVPKDYKLSSEWYKKAALQGHSAAQFSLGLIYYQGRGAARDYEQAKYWLEKSAENGRADARAVITDIDEAVSRQRATEYRTRTETHNTAEKVTVNAGRNNRSLI